MLERGGPLSDQVPISHVSRIKVDNGSQSRAIVVVTPLACLMVSEGIS